MGATRGGATSATPSGQVPSPKWVKAENGSVPAGAYAAGHEPEHNLYLCRGEYEGGLHIGKIGDQFSGCNIAWSSSEVTLSTYEVMTEISSPVWVDASNGDVPDGSLALGYESGGSPALYACRASYSSGVHLGKVRPGFSGCNFGWGGDTVVAADYQVLGTASRAR